MDLDWGAMRSVATEDVNKPTPSQDPPTLQCKAPAMGGHVHSGDGQITCGPVRVIRVHAWLYISGFKGNRINLRAFNGI